MNFFSLHTLYSMLHDMLYKLKEHVSDVNSSRKYPINYGSSLKRLAILAIKLTRSHSYLWGHEKFSIAG